MKKKNILWALLFAVIVLGGVLLYLYLGKGEGTVAVVSVDGEVLERIDLSKVREEYDLDVATEFGRNIVHVEPGAVSVTHADCPDHICVSPDADRISIAVIRPCSTVTANLISPPNPMPTPE